MTIISEAPKKTGGYVFLGWSTSSSATSATYASGGSFTTNAATTLYAVYEEATVSSVTLSITSTKWIERTYTFTIYATVTMTDANATPPTVTWTAEDSLISFSSSTSSSGTAITVTAVSKGHSSITASAGGVSSSSLTVRIADMMSIDESVDHFALSASESDWRLFRYRMLGK